MNFKRLTEEYNLVFSKYRKEVDQQIHEKGFAETQDLTQKLNELYPQIFQASKTESYFFTGASLNVYKDFLRNHIQKSQEEKPDFSIYDAYKKEYKNQRQNLNSTPKHFAPLNTVNLNHFKSIIRKRLEYLELKMFEMGIEIKTTFSEFGSTNVSFTDNLERRFLFEQKQGKINEESRNNIQPLKWRGNNTELAELIKALIESNKLDPDLTQKEIFNRFSQFLNYDIKETTGIKDFSKRKNNGGNLTKFLDVLKDSLNLWFQTKEEKKDYR